MMTDNTIIQIWSKEAVFGINYKCLESQFIREEGALLTA
jgi:hypothetical protein